MRTFKLPDLGEGLQEAEIVAWHVEPGDNVVADQPLVSVETDKAVVEIPAPFSGRIKELHGSAGDIVQIGAALIEFDGAGADNGGGDKTSIVGDLPKVAQRLEESAIVRARGGSGGKVKAPPAVRALAKQLGVDLDVVTASGPNGTVTARDVERAVSNIESLEPPEPLRGVRRAMALKMAESHAQVAPANVMDRVDVHAWPKGTDVTIRLIRAIANACKAQPSLNAWYDSKTMSRRLIGRVDLGIAVHTEDGLFVPVIRDAGSRTAADLRRGLDAMKADVEKRAIPPEELRGATITLSNFGIFGAGRFAEMVIVPPQVAIIGAGRAADEVVAVDGKPAVRRMMPLSLTFDHRVVNGGEAAGFLAALIADLAKAD